ncbi:hypothetical protein CLAFUW4_12320 [Fulvia fulva]|uniref:Uncharacterized protein n=1 Tax=Passalora fulva TaxID=5499 RepID=A0A9Q8PDN6_PASFU|nr:uncharacterized protein CLAFUR5_11350 [Fulvia fulva]KAK4618053.1 hypothetical protein CLAFUR4_12325 [Fulvia fulva]KAK4618889.1 hypothetical protein CLAFUR0_12336 [Fulvia fulva]UJO20568.1 hypothetical protein CLAFUR5_11350 [Fulvia fulva]WPV18272.1 hypothetical protein CLAFUW4_12320 [Fulvia fulva]WPV33653.1 hypothetical protein CLAFUW7_12327 [Fulvia fulva]
MDSTVSPLLALPAEIRNQIYSYALVDDLEQCVHDMPHACSLSSSKRGQAFQIPSWTYTCRQFRQEAGSLWMSEATFNFHAIAHVTKWLGSINVKHQSVIRTVRKWVPMHQRAGAEKLLVATCKALEEGGAILASDALMVGYFDDTDRASREDGGVSWIRGVGAKVAVKTARRLSVTAAEAEYLYH